MGESQGPGGPEVSTGGDRTPEEVQREIERTRTEMGDTVAELAAKTDIKAQAQRAAGNAKATVTGKATDLKDNVAARKDQITTSAQDAMPPSTDAARRQVMSQARDHQLALVGLAAFGLGLLIGKRRG